MSKRTEGRMVLTVGEEITRVNIIDGGKAVEILFSISESNEKKESEKVELQAGSKEFEEMFPIVDIENVSLDDSFMEYEPETDREKRVKASIIETKKIGMKNFRIPAMDPSLDDDGETIIYCAGRKPATGKSANWWYENAPRFMPNKNSRMRDDLQHDVVLGVMQVKYLVEEKGYKVAEAWKDVCVDSKDLGHYRYSEKPKYEYETTGSRQIGKCFDLGNTCKIVKKREASGFVCFGGNFNLNSIYYPLAEAQGIYDSDEDYNDSVGELVLDV